MSRSNKSVRTAILLAVAGVLGAVSFVGVGALRDQGRDDPVAEDAEPSTAAVSVDSLAETVEASGTIGHEPALEVDSSLSGTVLAIVQPGEVVSSGDVLARVDDRAVVWLDGDLPAWRDLEVGDEGDDVEQLEVALTDLGFNGGSVTVDDSYTAATAEMVERWQESLDVDASGAVELGSVVFAGDRDRVASVEADVGDSVEPGPLVSLGTDRRVATLEVDPADGVGLGVGDVVEVALPDRSVAAATVTTIQQGTETWIVTAALDDADLPAQDTIEIAGTWEHTIATDVLTVPSSAVLRLDDGSYVVDVVDEVGDLDRRQVSLGTSVGTRTEIVSGLTAGDVVLVL